MGHRDYERLPIEDFGRQLILSGDLDPVYIALRAVDWPEDQVHRWLVACWCFYHCGMASWMSWYHGKAYWGEMMAAAKNTAIAPNGGRWPRGHERRHARGEQGVKMVADLESRYDNNPENMVANILYRPRSRPKQIFSAPESFADMAARVRKHTLFGPWISFKVCDMAERVLDTPVDFSHADVFMFQDPVKAALMLWQMHPHVPVGAKPKNQAEVIQEIVAWLINTFSDLKAPPLYDRPIGLQEVKTILCKWKSHMNGHYPLNNEINEINAGLEGWGNAAKEFKEGMPCTT